MNTGISAYKQVNVETSKPEDLSKQVITSILSYINEAQSTNVFSKQKECFLNAQMLCVGAMFSLSSNERTKANIVLTNVFDAVQNELLVELKEGGADLQKCKTILSMLIEPPTLIG